MFQHLLFTEFLKKNIRNFGYTLLKILYLQYVSRIKIKKIREKKQVCLQTSYYLK